MEIKSEEAVIDNLVETPKEEASKGEIPEEPSKEVIPEEPSNEIATEENTSEIVTEEYSSSEFTEEAIEESTLESTTESSSESGNVNFKDLENMVNGFLDNSSTGTSVSATNTEYEAFVVSSINDIRDIHTVSMCGIGLAVGLLLAMLFSSSFWG